MNYNLLKEDWIPVLYANGEWKRVGILKAFEHAHRIRQIAATNPMDRVAILRFLLAILYWCKGSPPETTNADLPKSFPAEWFAKLEENRECFNLLGEGRRFFQIRKCGEAVQTKLPSNYLIHEIPTGRNAWHFRHSRDGANGLCLACCAVGLLRLPLFATSGGRGKPPGINAKPPLYAVPVGPSLATTLWLSWCEQPNLGTPAWESVNVELPPTGAVPTLVGLTWLPRRVWLDDPENCSDQCISCGREETLVRRCVFAGVGSTKTGDGESSRLWSDPHVIYVRDSKGNVTSMHASDALGAPDAAAGQWARIAASMVAQRENGDITSLGWADAIEGTRAHVWLVGFSTVQNDKYLEAMEAVVDLPFDVQELSEVIARFTRWQAQGRSLEARIQAIERPEKRGKSEKRAVSVVAAIRPHVEGLVSGLTDQLVVGGDEKWQEAAETYRPMMSAVSKSLSPGFTVQAVQRRRQMGALMPDVWRATKVTKEERRKKGGAR
ncbi:MAG TPA: type I-E CRISPR-associated protein Cse1/CasA [Candidatus Hydrogenedentes bacterium]|nr:type I-E CRISPR-associated protein Cse1/CasA [Candidatus Hydrogenedentota bacterium]